MYDARVRNGERQIGRVGSASRADIDLILGNEFKTRFELRSLSAHLTALTGSSYSSLQQSILSTRSCELYSSVECVRNP
jgi:hypothetical protein